MQDKSQEWLELSEVELLRELGRSEALAHDFAFPPSPKKLVKLGKEWFSKHREDLLDKVCENEKVTKYKHERNLLFDALCEIIVHVSLQVPAGCVAAYLVHRGVDALCSHRAG